MRKFRRKIKIHKGLQLPKLPKWHPKCSITLETRETKPRREMQKNNEFLHMLKGLAVALGVTCIFFVAYGMCLTYTEMNMDALPVVSLVCTAVSSAIAGFDWSKCKKYRGLFWGMTAGVCYAVVLFLLTSIGANGFSWSMSKGMTLVVAVAGGGLGGVLANFTRS